jgi:cyclase
MLIESGRAVITQKFNNPIYVGDPINAIKIFNDKEVDELIILDITAKSKRKDPDYRLIEQLASESFMPLAYGGHVVKLDQAERIINCGIEKVSFNSALYQYPETVKEVSNRYGRQSVIASIDFTKNLFGKLVPRYGNNKKTAPFEFAQLGSHIESLGVGEVFLNNIDNDGMRCGFNVNLISNFKKTVSMPVIACGGANRIEDFSEAINAGASAVAAGAMFYFKGNINAILINYPDQRTLVEQVYK